MGKSTAISFKQHLSDRTARQTAFNIQIQSFSKPIIVATAIFNTLPLAPTSYKES